MAKKAPPRTAERILEAALDLFNRFGEPNVSTTLISAELSISPGNLYYHYPAKNELINALFDRYEKALSELLNASDDVRNVEDAWFFMHTLFELIWQYRFLYRDLNDLLSKNRRLETHFQWVLKNKTRAVKALLGGMSRAGAMSMDAREVEATATRMVVVLTYWLSFEYVRDPRHALEPENAQSALLRGAHHVLNLLIAYLEQSQRTHLQALVSAYSRPAARSLGGRGRPSENWPKCGQFLTFSHPNIEILGKKTAKNEPLRPICSRRSFCRPGS